MILIANGNKRLCLIGALLFVMLLSATPGLKVYGASITVNNVCSLEDAITAANTDTATGGCISGTTGSDTITITPAGTVNGTITLATVLVIQGNASQDSIIIIYGNGTTISGGDTNRIFALRSTGDLTFYDLTLTDGRAANGGAIKVDEGGKLAVYDSVIENSVATSGHGGAINTTLPTFLKISGSIIRNNSSAGQGGGIYAHLRTEIEDTAIYGNTSVDHGGGIYVHGSGSNPTRIRRSSIYNNETTGTVRSGGGLYHFIGFLYVSNSSIFGNSATGSGGGIISANSTTRTYLTHVTIVNNAALDAGSIAVSSASVVYLRNSILGNSLRLDNQNLQITECSADIYESVNNLVDDTTCSPDFQGEPGLASATQGSPAYWPLLSSSPAIGKGHATYCAEVGIDQRGVRRPSSGCDLGAYQLRPARRETNGDGSSAARSRSDDRATATPTTGPSTGELLNAQGYRLSATYGLDSGVQFQRLGENGIGIQSVLNLGFIDAIDVWGYVSQGVTVCFPQAGNVVFLDASTAPRTVASIASYTEDGYTCVSLEKPGTLVLTQTLPTAFVPHATAAAIQTLSNCMVTTNAILNFRAAPNGESLGSAIPSGATLTALQRTSGWIKVDYHGTQGWISADYVTTQGTCA